MTDFNKRSLAVISFRNSEKFDQDATIILIDKEQIKKKSYRFKNKKLEEELNDLVKSGQFSGDKDEIFPVLIKDGLFLLTGLGKGSDLSLTALRISIRKALLSSFVKKCKTLEIIPH